MNREPLAAETRGAAEPARVLAFAYGVLAYAVFFGVFTYLILFVGDLWVPKAVDSGSGASMAIGLAIDAALIALFGVQHSVMARPAFKRAWTKLVPKPVERSTFVLSSTLVLAVVMWLWQPLETTIWSVQSAALAGALWAVYAAGWLIVVTSTHMTGHFDLFGLRQVTLYLVGKPYVPVEFKQRGLYRHMRHPLYAGFFLGFWATPHMTLGHLVLAAGFSTYIVIGTLFEERDLLATFGERYRQYCRELPRYLPRLGSRRQPPS